MVCVDSFLRRVIFGLFLLNRLFINETRNNPDVLLFRFVLTEAGVVRTVQQKLWPLGLVARLVFELVRHIKLYHYEIFRPISPELKARHDVLLKRYAMLLWGIHTFLVKFLDLFVCVRAVKEPIFFPIDSYLLAVFDLLAGPSHNCVLLSISGLCYRFLIAQRLWLFLFWQVCPNLGQVWPMFFWGVHITPVEPCNFALIVQGRLDLIKHCIFWAATNPCRIDKNLGADP